MSKRADPTTIFLLHFFLGWSYGSLGKMTIQIVFYLSLITIFVFTIWYFYRLFTVVSAVRKYNRDLALSLGATGADLINLGLM
jgi:hypothetical protein